MVARRGARPRRGRVRCCGAFDWQVPENFAKFGAVTCLGWLFLRAFEELSWVVIVSLAIPFVDAYSVWRGPTHTITEHHAGVFTTLLDRLPGARAATRRASG